MWLGLDHAFALPGEKHKPLIFETMAFEGKERKRPPSKFAPKGYTYHESYETYRYSTEKQAIRGHKKVLEEYTQLEKLGSKF